MDKNELKKYVIAEAKKILNECGDVEIEEGLGSFLQSADKKALKWGQDLVATAAKVGKKVGYQWALNYIRDTFKIKSGDIPRILKNISPLYQPQDASKEYSIGASYPAGHQYNPATEGVELNEGITPGQVQKLVKEMKKINKKIDLRNPLLTKNINGIVDSIIEEEKVIKEDIINENVEVDRWKNLTEYTKFSEE